MGNSKDKEVIILIGPPGSGKGTQAELLADKLDLFYFETSKIIEERVMNAKENEIIEIDSKKYFLAHEKHLWETGILCTPEVVSFWVKNKIKELFEDDKSLVIAGSPRTMHEGEQIIPFIEKLYGKDRIKIFNIQISGEESIHRNSNRKICSVCRHPIPYFEETKDLEKCPICGGELIKRKGLDDPEHLQTRLIQYKERTEPLLDYFRKLNFKVIEINGEQSIEKVFADILKHLK